MDPFTIYMAATMASGALEGGKGYLGAVSQSRSYGQQALGYLLAENQLGKQEAATVDLMSKQGEQLKASQRVAYLGSGIDITEGTPLQNLIDTAYSIQKDIQTYKYNTEIEKSQLRSQAFQAIQAQKAAKKSRWSQLLMPIIKAGASTAISGYKGKAAGGGKTAPSDTGMIDPYGKEAF